MNTAKNRMITGKTDQDFFASKEEYKEISKSHRNYKEIL